MMRITAYSRNDGQPVELVVRCERGDPEDQEASAVYLTLWYDARLLHSVAIRPGDARRLAAWLVKAAQEIE
jgi:hypothetical protein